MHRPRVVIVGAGFGGIAAARALADTPVDVTIVDQHNFHTFSPLLYQVATSSLAPDDIAPNLRYIVRNDPNIEARLNTVRGVDFERREVLVDGDATLAYDYLVLAAGAVSSDFGVPGAAEHAIPLKTLADASKIRNTVLARFEEADADPSRVDDGTLTFVVAGGGPTGVELCGALGELIALVLRKDFKRLDVGRARVILVEMTEHVLGSFSPRSRAEAKVELAQRGVEVRLGVAIAAVADDRVELGDGTVIPTRTVLWTAGVKANPVASALSLAQTARARSSSGPTSACPDTPRCSSSATSPGSSDPTASRSRSWRRWRSSRAGTWPAASCAGCGGSRRSPSATSTRARWPPSGAARRWPSFRWASGSAARSAG